MADTSITHRAYTTCGSSTSNAGTLPQASVRVVAVPARPHIAVIELHGEIDLHVAPALEAGLTAGLHRRAHLLVDLSGVDLIDCRSLGLLVRARHAAQQRHTVLALVAPSPLVRLILHATRLGAVFPTFTDREQALATLQTDDGEPLRRTNGRRSRNEVHARRSPNGTRP